MMEERIWTVIAREWSAFLEKYELRADEGDHTPTEFERFMMEDALAGFMSEDNALSRLMGQRVMHVTPDTPGGKAVWPVGSQDE